ncbi:zinc-ribbon domain-containing protein [Enterococcus cecorum]|nr:zinc-ribbon domain-containing protein [Enterococcus cecorum]CAI3336718.1 zinc-ribbon domain-containing protein [Enterococcus cecorum]
MKKCPNCQTEVEEEALVCPQCGYQWETNAEKVEQVVSEEVVSEEKTQSVQQAANEEVSNPENEDKAQTTVAPQTPEESEESEEETNNQSSENSKKVLDFEKLDDFEALKPHVDQAKNYFEELKATILHPTIGEIKYKTLGIINFIVIGLLFSLTFSRLLGVMLKGIYGAMNQFTNMFGFGQSSYGSSSISAFPMFWLFLLAIFLTQIILVLVYWIFEIIMQKEGASFKNALDQIFEPLSVLVVVGIVAFVFALLGSVFLKLALILCVLYLLILRYSFDGNIWLIANPKGFNRFYITMIPVALYSVVSYFVFKIVLGVLIENSNILGIIENMLRF